MINSITPGAVSVSTQAAPDPTIAQKTPNAANRVTAVEKTLDSRMETGSQTNAAPASSGPDKALDEVNGQLKAWSTGMQFEFDEEAQRIVVSIVDNNNGEVLRTVPSETVLQVAKMIIQLQGQGVDTKA